MTAKYIDFSVKAVADSWNSDNKQRSANILSQFVNTCTDTMLQSDMPLDDTDMSEAALGAEKVTSSEKQEKREKISCALCSCTLNSESQAQAHFSGVRHLKLLERHGLPLPEGVNRDKLLVHQRKTYQNGKDFKIH